MTKAIYKISLATDDQKYIKVNEYKGKVGDDPNLNLT